MTAIIDFVLGAPFIIKVVIGVLVLLAVMFIFLFLIRAIYIWIQLSILANKLRSIKDPSDQNIAVAFASSKLLTHLWSEYRDTLHEQREL
ncbi:MAG: hypothetical protein ABSC25_13940 [Roseiarcus sp.]|jgi:hypothetical protein